MQRRDLVESAHLYGTTITCLLSNSSWRVVEEYAGDRMNDLQRVFAWFTLEQEPYWRTALSLNDREFAPEVASACSVELVACIVVEHVLHALIREVGSQLGYLENDRFEIA